MNENLVERFGRARQAVRPERETAQVWILPPTLNHRIRQYFQPSTVPIHGGAWLSRPAVPSSEEILDTDTASSNSADIVEIVPNKPQGAWESKEAYLSTQYELLREDALQPLRLAVARMRITPEGNEETFSGTIGIYDKVHICGVTCANRGIALRVTFSLGRVGKKIRWDQSKRLISGGLVVLTPKADMFQKRAIVATVAARPLELLDLDPPEIDLYIARPEDMEIDPAVEWVMVEDRGGFYEADKHTLVALQRMMRESFPLAEHLVFAQPKIAAPTYVVDKPKRDLSSVMRNNEDAALEDVDILRHWPAQPSSDMDVSQLAALRRILTKRLAVIQGPPGTGKTYVSEQAIRIMLANGKPNDPPIIIACQTNHAVDQLLRKVAEFEKDFVRLGGRSKDKEVIKKRTLYEVKMLTSNERPAGSLLGGARKRMQDLEKEIKVLLSPLKPEKNPLDFAMLKDFGLLTLKQADSLAAGASRWVQDKCSNLKEAKSSPFNVWLGKVLVSVPPKQQSEEFGFDFEEQDLAFENLKELEAETMAKDDEDFETLRADLISIADNFTCRKVTGITEAKVQDALRQEDMWKIPEVIRGEVYRYLQSEAKRHIRIGFREKARIFNEQATKRQIGQWEHDEIVLKQQKVIGMTTTGFSKYRGLLAALQPKVVLIEEAAETLEAPVTVACLPSLEHLILVGDHKQLRPHCHVKAHEDEPFFLNVSLFERLVNNNVEYNTLAKQRRMIPEIRRILFPIYGELIQDHASVRDPERRPDVPGMGGVNSFFFTHQWPEQRDDQMSSVNPDEAEMIMGFLEYLMVNGVQAQDITILTFYNGQRKRILSLVRDNQRSERNIFRDGLPTIVTVDSYQGEENKIVILSLVRSNDHGKIGFLSIDNRVCVALSRAQCGFYIFGNAMLLYNEKYKTWLDVINIMAGKKRKSERPKHEPSRLNDRLPIRCKEHNRQSLIGEAADWQTLSSSGGCDLKCDGTLACGHECVLNCHPYDHDAITCHQACSRKLPCGHGTCEGDCGMICSCKICNKGRVLGRITDVSHENQPVGDDGRLSRTTSETSSSWHSFAVEEPGRYATAAAVPPSSRRGSPQKQSLAKSEPKATKEDLLVDFANDGTSQVLGGRSVSGSTVKSAVGGGSKVPAMQVKSGHSSEKSLLDEERDG
ncbi:hypothetical protein LTR91_005563 [Friedmanniomyces endolithicus]|uniref:Helicase ATP-binding domain-containing protein n=1 Tax=Friedmanniomyces endolithicus TaxID=329885 RepID=A0AAN6QXZ1_9PEZI|nr:hypothetical protein LTR35_008534 [Friedmanniomyces endolithicus]KAK0294716.1 hypothetical protein LTS00_006551 [Friedmanniomyces endolithicus]KAK0322415.1 hypothetical protein LTR82_006374 [Friedmanniomyces endolithicus]KAK0922070.1 hypothetical protein LTR57_008214 [Friedmanniomyces endolithicus]KAK1000992.1 hypothetical protein LTR91_005563 [Friedmanniomyces endolithicus]